MIFVTFHEVVLSWVECANEDIELVGIFLIQEERWHPYEPDLCKNIFTDSLILIVSLKGNSVLASYFCCNRLLQS